MSEGVAKIKRLRWRTAPGNHGPVCARFLLEAIIDIADELKAIGGVVAGFVAVDCGVFMTEFGKRRSARERPQMGLCGFSTLLNEGPLPASTGLKTA